MATTIYGASDDLIWHIRPEAGKDKVHIEFEWGKR